MDPALYKAATHGDMVSLRELMVRDLKILNSKTPQGNTVLHVAALHSQAKVAREVLKVSDELLVAQNDDGDTPLHLAAKAGKAEVAEVLVTRALGWPEELVSPLVMTNKPGSTPLHMAAREGLVQVVRKMVEMLLERRRLELMDMTDSDGNNALHYAAQKDRHGAVELLLRHRTQLAYQHNHQGMSPLHVAAHYGSTDAITALLRHCPDVAETVDSDSRNAFHASVISGKANALRCLLRRVRLAELLNRVDGNGDTPLHLAAKMSRVHSALVLLSDRRVDPCVRDREGHTARSIVEMKLHTGEMDTYELYLWKQLKYHESKRCGNQQLPLATIYPGRSRGSTHKHSERMVRTYVLVATLIATVTFAAAFTMPGGYKADTGISIHGHSTAFKIFVISNSIAICSSIVIIFCFIRPWQGPVMYKFDKALWGHRLTVLACLAMLVSLMAAVYITVAPTSRWPAYVVIAIGISTPAVVFFMVGKEAIFVPL